MKKLLVLLLTVFALNSCEKDPEIIGVDAEKKQLKVDVCHYDADTDTWKTINISKNALKAHLKHGDFEGSCEERKTYVPDNGFEQHLINLGYDDILDDYVLTSNINTVEFLSIPLEVTCDAGNDPYSDCHNGFYYVRNLIGIEDFIGLKRFRAWEMVNYQPSTINLSTLHNLEYIYLYEVPIDELDLSNNPLLKSVSIEACPNIKYLNLKNGNNINITYFNSTGSGDSGSYCVQVDDYTVDHLDEAPYNTWVIDPWAIFSADCSAEPERTYVPDDGFEQRLIDYGYDDIPDDFVLTSNISNLTSLVLNGDHGPGVTTWYISDLTGIEDFKSLTYLLMYDQFSLKEIDLSGNIALTKLEIQSWNGPAGLVNLNLTKNAALELLQIEDAPYLVDLNLTNNTNLTHLFCRDMTIDNLNVTKNTKLTYFAIYNTNLTSLDLTKNTKIAHLELLSNQLTTLNIKNGNNSLISLFDASGSPDLTCIQVDDYTVDHLDEAPYNNWRIDSWASFSKDCGY